MDLSIIIVNWNSKNYLDSCLASIYRSRMGLTFEIIVIDNASFDGSGEMIQAKYLNVQYIQSHINGGFSYANNLGAEISKGTHLLFLNPDTEVIGDAIEELHQVHSTGNDIGITGCTLLNRDGSIQTSCIQAFPTILNQIMDSDLLQKFTPRSRLWGHAALFEKKNTLSEVEVISGACLMIKRELFQIVGQFSQDYFMFAEDLDLCFKIRQAGFRVLYAANPKVYHYGGGSTGNSTGRRLSNVRMRNSIYCFLKQRRGGFYAGCYRVSMAITALIRIGLLSLSAPFHWFRRGSLPTGRIAKWAQVLLWALNRKSQRYCNRATP